MNTLTLLEIFVTVGSVLQIIAAMLPIPLFFLINVLRVSRRSWALFALCMIGILIRRSLAVWGMISSNRVLLGETGVSLLLSALYIVFELSVYYDTIRIQRE